MSTEIVETVGQGARPADLFTNPPSLTAIESRPTIVVSSVLLAVSKTMCITNRGDGAGGGVHPDRLVVGVNGFAGISFAWMGLRRGDRAAGGESSTLSRLTTLTGCMDGVGSDIRLLVTRAGIGTSAMRPFATCQHGLPKRW